MPVFIRQLQINDAQTFADLMNQVDTETQFLFFEPGERQFGAEQAQRMIEQMQTGGESTIFVAEHEGELVGFLRARGETIHRLRHTLYIVIAIRQAFVGQGIGSRLFLGMEQWARERKLHRLYLTVMAHNERAIALYKKMGFEIEGLHKHAVLIDGEYVDEVAMVKLLT
jgi:RimJ/RimL family protein N-acetyltransferase